MTQRVEEDAPYAFEGLDRLFHERARLGIVTSLAGSQSGIAFTELKRLCGLTDGNLNRHLTALEDAGFVSLAKDLEQKRPVTICRLTRLGRDRFISYLAALEGALREGTRAAGSGREQLRGRTA